jgi:hypothetical protein
MYKNAGLQQASISHSYAYIMEHGSTHIKRTALQRVYTASNSKSFAGQPIHSTVFFTYLHRNRLCQRLPALTAQPATTQALPASLLATTGRPQRRHRATARKTAALASSLQREASDKRPFSVPPIAPSSVAQASRYESSLHQYYSDTLPACLKYPF